MALLGWKGLRPSAWPQADHFLSFISTQVLVSKEVYCRVYSRYYICVIYYEFMTMFIECFYKIL
jgi:hypothetical protein